MTHCLPLIIQFRSSHNGARARVHTHTHTMTTWPYFRCSFLQLVAKLWPWFIFFQLISSKKNAYKNKKIPPQKIYKIRSIVWVLWLMIVMTYNGNSGLHYSHKLRITYNHSPHIANISFTSTAPWGQIHFWSRSQFFCFLCSKLSKWTGLSKNWKTGWILMRPGFQCFYIFDSEDHVLDSSSNRLIIDSMTPLCKFLKSVSDNIPNNTFSSKKQLSYR